ncbi:MAG TPA: (d)CMP kinase [Candidatus Fimenecus excrementigallinarum]|uniref:Cytidylate kinase n=1 Tax=Candidatus Fimenecus excrementigallinarum TaxID=2840816 RepID=A0A9D1IE62_9FIRM|nr:(d)CMP kinase [Candidatus Fimenecus excrementigallinarum]
MPINVAIDGPAGAGKSSIARAAAKRLGYIYVDTGALYRAVGVYSLRNGVDTKNAEAVTGTLPHICVDLKFQDGVQHVYLNDEDVSEEIRTPPASMAASDVSAVPAVRQFLFDLQRDIAAKNDCIMDGRDIGTVVLPDAQVKIFLTASPEARAMRRFLELQQKGAKDTYAEVLADLVQRDYNDSHRAVAPLKPAEDGVTVDNSGLSLDDSIEQVLAVIRETLAAKQA